MGERRKARRRNGLNYNGIRRPKGTRKSPGTPLYSLRKLLIQKANLAPNFGLVAGVIQEVTATYVSLDLENAAIFAAFIIVLAFRPNGLFGRQVMS